MRFSIIIPVYNKEAYIGECLDSVLAQALSDFEVIAVDDGSTDGSAAVCAEYAERDNRITLIREQNAGPSVARNTGVNAAKGDYLVFLDCDDKLAEGSLEAVETAAEGHDRPDLVVCCIDRFVDGGSEHTYYDGVDELPDSGTGDELAAHIETKHNKYSISPCRYAIKRSFYEAAELSFKPGIKQEDELFTPLMVCAAESFAVCRRSFYLYRIVKGSRNDTPTIENKLSFLKISEELFEKKAGCGSDAKCGMLKKRGKYMFRRGILEHNEVIGDRKKELVNTAALVYNKFPEAAEDTNSLRKLIKLFGCKRGISVFLWMSRLIGRS